MSKNVAALGDFAHDIVLHFRTIGRQILRKSYTAGLTAFLIIIITKQVRARFSLISLRMPQKSVINTLCVRGNVVNLNEKIVRRRRKFLGIPVSKLCFCKENLALK